MVGGRGAQPPGHRGSHIPARQDLITLGMGTVATRTTAESLPSAEVRPWSWAGGSLTGVRESSPRELQGSPWLTPYCLGEAVRFPLDFVGTR